MAVTLKIAITVSGLLVGRAVTQKLSFVCTGHNMFG